MFYTHKIMSFILSDHWRYIHFSQQTHSVFINFSLTTIIIPKAIKQQGSPPSFTQNVLFQPPLTPWNLCRESLLSVSCPSGQSGGDHCEEGSHHHQYHRHGGGQRATTDRVCLPSIKVITFGWVSSVSGCLIAKVFVR